MQERERYSSMSGNTNDWNEDFESHVKKIHQLEREAIKIANPLADLKQWRESKALKELTKEFKEEQWHQLKMGKDKKKLFWSRQQDPRLIPHDGGNNRWNMMVPK